MSRRDGNAGRWARWRGRALLVALGLGVGFLVAEVVLRFAGVSFPVLGTADPVTGTALLPGAEGWYRKEGEAFVRINSDGLRDRERPVEKPDGTFRVAVFGDSYTEARQVPLEDAFPAVLEAELARLAETAAPGLRVEVLNFGVTGYGTTRSLLRLGQKGWPYRPDVVLLAFLSGNDIRDNDHALAKRRHVPFMKWHAGRLELDTSFRETTAWQRRWRFDRLGIGRWINRSAVLQLVKEAARPRRSAPAFDPSRPWDEPGNDLEIYRPPQDDTWRQAWALTEAILEAFHEEVRSHEATFVLATVSNAIQVHPDPALRRRFQAELGIDDPFYPERRLGSWAEARSIPFVALAPSLQHVAEREGVFLHGFDDRRPGTGHWNIRGHREAGLRLAEAIAPWLTSRR